MSAHLAKSSGDRSVIVAAVPMLGLLLLPIVALLMGARPEALREAVVHPTFLPAMWLSARTSLVSLVIIVAAGTPLSWWLATSQRRFRRIIEPLVEVPIVLPPAVVGIALLQTFGRNGVLGGYLGIQVPFTTLAVLLAQVTVAAPFYVQSATAAFRRVDTDLLVVARTLGQTQWGAFFRVAVPVALPGLIGGAALAWARAIGEFGATLLFAGNLPGTTQTMPLAIYSALEADVGLAVSLSLVLATCAIGILLVLRLSPHLLSVRTRSVGGDSS